MSVSLVVCCEGRWHGDGRPCGDMHITTGTDEADARLQAVAAGWQADPQRGDLCPAHARRKDAR